MTSSSLDLLNKTLKANKASLTGARKAVFDLLEGREPQSMNELLKRSKGHFDKASLYRTINLFERIGVITRVNFGFKYKVELTDSFSHHHHHLNCLACGRIISVKEDTRLKSIINGLALEYSFKPTAHQFEIQGYCEACAKEEVLAKNL